MRRAGVALLAAAVWWGCGGDSAVDAPDGAAADTASDADDTGDADAPEASDATDTDAPEATVIEDAGDEAWVKQALLALVGRRARGMVEVRVLVDLVEATDRTTVARGLLDLPEARQRWTAWIADDLKVQRIGELVHDTCFGPALRPTVDPALAVHVRDSGPRSAAAGGAFGMRDLVAAALELDDISVVYRANLFSMMARPTIYCPNVPAVVLDLARRRELSTRFAATYTGRVVDCLPCHNSEASVTDGADPESDRFWPLAGFVEAALYGSSAGRDADELAAMFRVFGVLSADSVVNATEVMNAWPADPAPAESPWGIDSSCGAFLPPEATLPDDAAIDAWFAGPLGVDATVWDLESRLRAGVDRLRGPAGEVPAEGQLPEGEAALAWALAGALADRLWAEVHGAPLTLPHGFARNVDQRDVLDGLARRLVAEGWSLKSVLADAVTHPTFNVIAPVDSTNASAADPFILPALFEPFSREESEPERRGNGVGDRIHRPGGRVLESMVRHALDWPAIPEFPGTDDDATDAWRAVGAFLSDNQPAVPGISVQGQLSWEASLGSCRPLPVGESDTGCADPPCPVWPEDWLDRAVAEASTAGVDTVTVGDLVRTLADRLVAEPDVPADEAPLLAALFDVGSLDTPLASAPDWAARARRLCSMYLNSPQFLLTGLPPRDQVGGAGLVVDGWTYRTACDALAPVVLPAARHAVTCGDDAVTVTTP